MSSENIVKMVEMIEKNSEIGRKYAEMITSFNRDMERALTEKIVEFAKANGIPFTMKEYGEFTKEVLKKLQAMKEFSDEELKKVSGGTLPDAPGLGPAAAAVNAYLGQAQSQTILFANMVNQQAQYASTAAATLSQELAQLLGMGSK